MRYPACDEQHTEQKLQPAKQDLHRAQASTNRQECDAVRIKYAGAKSIKHLMALITHQGTHASRAFRHLLCLQDLLAGRLSQAKERHSQEICIMQERYNRGLFHAIDVLYT